MATVQAPAADPSLRKLPRSIMFQGLRVSISVTRSLGSKFAQRQGQARTAAASARQSRKKVNRAKRKAQQQRAAADTAEGIVPTGPTPLLYPSPEKPSPGTSASVVAGCDGDVVTASHAPARSNEESEGSSHAPESAVVATSTDKRQDADVASDPSDSDVTSPSDSMAIVPLTPDDAIGVGVRRSTRPHKKLKPYYEVSTAPAKGLRAGIFG